MQTRRDFAKWIVTALGGAAALTTQIGSAAVVKPATTRSRRNDDWMPGNSNFMYPTAMEAMLSGEINFKKDDFNLALMAAPYRRGEWLYEHVAQDIEANQPITLTISNFRSITTETDVFYGAVSGRMVHRLCLYRAAPQLNYLIASLLVSGLPMILNGGDVQASWGDRPRKLFSL